MTELISAERLGERVSGKSCQGYPKWLIPLIREAQRNALEAAAKAVCPGHCGLGARSHPGNRRRYLRECSAQPIHALLDELKDPAPAGQPPEEIIEIDEDGVVHSLGRSSAPAGQTQKGGGNE